MNGIMVMNVETGLAQYYILLKIADQMIKNWY